MPFEIAPKITTNPWTEEHPKEARAFADLAKHLRGIDEAHWYYQVISIENRIHRADLGKAKCGTVGCAIGHAMNVRSCKEAFPNTFLGTLDMNSFEPLLGRRIAHSFFLGGSRYGEGESYGVPFDSVTPQMVADRIDHWLATGEIR
jgi:hypothetical protein